jgi:hypothetical protein
VGRETSGLTWEKKAAQERWRGERADQRPWPIRLGRKSEMGPRSKRIFFEFQLILEFGRTLENCTRRFRKKFVMGIFPKIF